MTKGISRLDSQELRRSSPKASRPARTHHKFDPLGLAVKHRAPGEGQALLFDRWSGIYRACSSAGVENPQHSESWISEALPPFIAKKN